MKKDLTSSAFTYRLFWRACCLCCVCCSLLLFGVLSVGAEQEKSESNLKNKAEKVDKANKTDKINKTNKMENLDAGTLILSDFQPGSVKWYDTSAGKMGLEYVPEGVRVMTNFGTNPNSERVSIDAKMNLDLTKWNRFQVEVAVTNPAAFSSSSLYFHSGDGWYSCGSGVPRDKNKMTFQKSDFRTEGNPAGWDKIDTVRISLWKVGTQDSTVQFSSLACCSEPILFMSILNSEGIENWVGKNNGHILARQLSGLGILSDHDTISRTATEEEWAKVLETRLAVVINRTLFMTPETRTMLEKWAKENSRAVYFIDGDLRENPIPNDELLPILAQSTALKKRIEKIALKHSVTVLGKTCPDAKKILKRGRTIFENDGIVAGMKFCNETHDKLLTEAAAKIDLENSLKFRAWWNHNGLGAYPGDWKRTAKELKAAGFNTVIPNMVWVCEALYPSKYAPLSKNGEEYGDQLAQCLEACHAEGIEVHVWRVCFNVSWRATPEFIAGLEAEGRLQKDRNGETVKWLCPSNPKNIELEVNSMIEIADNYPVDGVHFDYIRYNNSEGCSCEGCRERFQKETGIQVEKWPLTSKSEHWERWVDWKADQITNIVRQVRQEMKKKHPKVKVSAAVFQGYPSSRRSVGQDWAQWAHEGLVDFLCPMNYTLDAGTFETLMRHQMTVVPKDFPLYFGIGEWKLAPDDTIEQIQRAKEVGAQGITVFDLSEPAAKRVLPLLTE
ncbi:MAG: family 10 glycosylhydrolase, partial [Planctomycetia bacterium]|nr:family 10 glycosylhydrolase [Planctomycetia bacterium]